MANRFWVGGTASWDNTAGAKWALTSGGAGGQTAPGTADDVFFDAASGAVTVTISATNPQAKTLNFTGFTGTLAGSANLNVAGSLTLVAGMTFTHTGNFQFSGIATVITAGKTVGSISVATGGNATLGGALTCSNGINVGSGTFSTNNFAITAPELLSTGTSSRTINLGSSAVALSSTGIAVDFTTPTNLTFNANTSTISITSVSATFSGGGRTFNTVNFTNTAATTRSITGANTFFGLSFTGQTSAGINEVLIGANQTITSTLTLASGGLISARTFIRSSVKGTSRTLTVATLAAGAAHYDFQDIVVTGTAAPISGTAFTFGDCKGNSGITFSAGRNVYWRSALGASWGFFSNVTPAWNTVDSGSPNSAVFPLAQDTAIFGGEPSSGSTITLNAGYNIGTVDMSARTSSSMTLATGTTTPTIYGNWVNGTGTTLTGTGDLIFEGRTTQTVTSAGKTFTQGFKISTIGGSVTLQDAFTCSSNNPFFLTDGTFNSNGFAVTLNGATSDVVLNGSSTRTLAIGSSTWVIAGSGTVWDATSITGLTVTGTGTISLTSASTKTFIGGGVRTYPTVNQGGAGALDFTGNNKFANITNTYSATGATTVRFAALATNDFDAFNLTGESGRVCTLQSISGTLTATLRKPGTWFVGANSTNVSNNTGLIFTAGGGIDFLAISRINGGIIATTYSVFIVEAASGIDNVLSFATFGGSASEAASGIDATTSGTVFRSSTAEAASGVDATASAVLFGSTAAETASGVDAVSSVPIYPQAIAEVASGVDTTAATRVLAPAVSETASGTDTLDGISGIVRNIDETASGADDISSAPVATSTITEASSGADTASSVALFGGTVFETASGADAVSSLRTLPGTIVESSTGEDSLTASVAFASQNNESASGVDVVSTLTVLRSSTSESAAGIDTQSLQLQIGTAVVEAASGVETAATKVTFGSSAAETASGADAAVGSIRFTPVIVESAGGVDAVSGAQVFVATAVESGSGVDLSNAELLFSGATVETASGVDTTLRIANFGGTVNESAVGDDQVVAANTLFVELLEFAAGLDDVSPAGSAFNAQVLEGIAALDLFSALYLWNLIDDTQNADWAVLNNAQTPAWASVNDSAPAAWQNVANPQTPGWTDVDDTQTPGWTPITP